MFAEVLNYDKVITNLKGIKEFEKENFTDSEKEFSKNSINHPRDGRLHFNLGNSHYKNGKLEDAENDYNLALKDKDFTNKSSVYHNLGNVKSGRASCSPWPLIAGYFLLPRTWQPHPVLEVALHGGLSLVH